MGRARARILRCGFDRAEMPQIFHKSANTISRFTIFGAVLFLVLIGWVLAAVAGSPWISEADVVREQPVPFSHEHHVRGLGLDCRYCHDTVERSSFAGMPATETCMTCHSHIWTDAAILAPVRESYRTGRSLQWIRVNDLPDFVYFDHSIHVHKGIGCVTCHGRVDEMPLTWRGESLQMIWCLDCHRNPIPDVRPREKVFDMSFPKESEAKAARLAADYRVHSRTDCYTCHR
jgi:Cytochrome c7 and related cytochrome c